MQTFFAHCPWLCGNNGQSFLGFFGLAGLRERDGAVEFLSVMVIPGFQVGLTVTPRLLVLTGSQFLAGCRYSALDGTTVKKFRKNQGLVR